jgi:hypothetical protein
MIEQLTLDGGAVPYARARRQRRLTSAQRDILVTAQLQGHIRSVEAGKLIHHHRGECRAGAPQRKDALGCCFYCATDGSMACRRLAERGLLARDESGVRPVWRAT